MFLCSRVGHAQTAVSGGGALLGESCVSIMARTGEESSDLDFRGGVLSLSGSGNGGRRMDRLLCFADGIARGGDGFHDASFLLVGADVGPRFGKLYFLRHFPERRVLRAGYAAGAAGIALMSWIPTLAGVVGGALITGLSFATLYPITVARLSQRFGVAARSIGAVMFSLASLGPAAIP